MKLYNMHPGATCGLCSDEEALDRIASQINAAHAGTENVVVVLENTAGGGSTLGRTFDQIRYV
jgi:endonuclease IV